MEITKKIVSVMYFLYLFGLLGSVSLMEIFSWGTLAVILFVWLVGIVKNPFKEALLHPLTKYFLFFALVLVLSIKFSPFLELMPYNKLYYFGRTRIFLLYVFQLVILTHFVDYKKALEILSYLLLFLAAVSLFISISGYNPLTGHYSFSWDFSLSRGVHGFFIHYIEYTWVYEIHFFILLPFIFEKLNRIYKIWLFSALSVALVSILFSGTRTVFYVLPAAIIAQFIMGKSKKEFFSLLIGAFIILIFAFAISPHLRGRLIYTIENWKDFGDVHRKNIWKSHWKIFCDYPLLGAGYEIAGREPVQRKYFQKIGFDEESYNTNYKHIYKKAHNMFLYYLSGSGIIGFLTFILLIVIYTSYLIRTWKAVILSSNSYDKALITGLIGASVAIFGNMIFDSNLDNIKAAASIMFAFALVGHLGTKYGIKKL